jgi:hypothetical protein
LESIFDLLSSGIQISGKDFDNNRLLSNQSIEPLNDDLISLLETFQSRSEFIIYNVIQKRIRLPIENKNIFDSLVEEKLKTNELCDKMATSKNITTLKENLSRRLEESKLNLSIIINTLPDIKLKLERGKEALIEETNERIKKDLKIFELIEKENFSKNLKSHNRASQNFNVAMKISATQNIDRGI